MSKVFIGISGGVDSSVAALLLKNQGYQVTGVHFSLTNKVEDCSDAQSVCDSLGIPLEIVDFSKIFNEKVFSVFVNDYQNGLTPNLCVMCNQFVKFGALYDYATSKGADYIATGHYCSNHIINGRCFLEKPIDDQKDQTYFLNQASEKVIAKTIFPLAHLTKPQVREIAETNNLVTAHKKGSSDICLMGDMDFRTFIRPFVKPKIGKIISTSGEMVGKHDGLFNYTLGQRKGLGLGGKCGETGRWFVVQKDVKNNFLIVSHGSEQELFSKTANIINCNWIGFEPQKTFRAFVKHRYRQQSQLATIEVDGNSATIIFDEPQRAITPSQYCVIYDENFCLGGGKIV